MDTKRKVTRKGRDEKIIVEEGSILRWPKVHSSQSLPAGTMDKGEGFDVWIASSRSVVAASRSEELVLARMTYPQSH